jgi:hypothetical protein
MQETKELADNKNESSAKKQKRLAAATDIHFYNKNNQLINKHYDEHLSKMLNYQTTK